MSICGFCGRQATLTREDLIPKWMGELKPDTVKVKAERQHRNIRQWTTVKDRVELTARAFCARCNNGWMSELENEAKPCLLPMLLGHEVRLSLQAQAIIAVWIMKTAMAHEFAGASSRTFYFSGEERRIFASLQTPPAGVAIFLAGYVGRTAFSGEEEHLQFRRQGGQFPGYTCTLQWGALIAQVMAHRGGGGPSLFKVNASYDPAELQIWPLARELTWPPGAVLDDVELPRYVRRWSVEGEG